MKCIFIILLLIIIIIITLLFFSIILQNRHENKVDKFDIIDNIDLENKIFDYVIVGGGITGTYLAYSLKKKFPSKSIILLEVNNFVGGRLSSLDVNLPDNINLEYGGMRCFKEIHPKLIKLLEELNISTIKVPYKEHNNIYNLRGNIVRAKNLFPDSNLTYFVKENEMEMHIFKEIDKILKNKLFKYINKQNILDYNSRLEISKSEDLSKLTFNSLILNGKNAFSIENWNRYLDIFGYNSLYNREESLLSGCVENYSLLSEHQYFIKGGTQSIVKNLIKNFKLLDNFSEKIFANSVILNTKLFKIDKNSNVVECHILNTKNHKNTIIKCHKLYLCTPLSEYKNILQTYSKCFLREKNDSFYVKNCKELFDIIDDNLDTYSLSKIFLYYEKNWWSSIGINRGRNTTSDKLNQVWFYDDNHIMIYSSLSDADYWNSSFPYTTQKEMLNCNNNNTNDNTTNTSINNLNKLIQEKLLVMFKDFNLDIPLANKIGWKYWKEAYTQWSNIKTYNSNYKNIDQLKQKLRYPFENITYINNDTSLNQGWMEGSLEEVDDVLLQEYN